MNDISHHMSLTEPPNSHPELSVIVPFFNEGLNVRRVLDELKIVLAELTLCYEVLAVDDGSGDDTAWQLQQVQKDWPELKVFCHVKNRGQAAALWTAFDQAQGRLLATLDGDGQNDPRTLAQMIRHLEDEKADMVAGVRAARQDSWLRRKMSLLANRVRQVFLKDGVSDSGCALKVFRREVVTSFLPLRTLYSFMPALAVAAGFKVVEMAVPHRSRVAGLSNYGLMTMLWRPAVDMIGIWWFGQRRFSEREVPNADVQAPAEKRCAPWWLWILVVAVLFSFLGSRGLNEPDEGRYAEVAREMSSGGDWLVPHLNGFEHFQKPPLIYWFTAASLKLFGENEWAARLPSALAAAGVILLTFFMARKLWGRKRATVATVILVSMGGFFVMARLLTPDMLMTFWITAAIAALVYDRPWTFFMAMGLGFLTKGPMAFVVPLSAALGTHLAGAPNLSGKRWPWARGLLLSLALGLSWFMLLAVLNPDLFDYFWRYELVQRFASTTHGRMKPWWFFLPILPAVLLPWTFFLPGGLRALWGKLRTRKITRSQGMLLGWIALPLLILSFSGSKLPTYVLPLFPAFALAFSLRVHTVKQALGLALPCCALWLTAAAIMPEVNMHLKQQASLLPLVEKMREKKDLAKTEVFACGIRAHGLEFYLGRVVAITRQDLDITLPPSPAQSVQVLTDVKDCLHRYVREPAFGLMRRNVYNRNFAPAGWKLEDESGDFVLVSNFDLLVKAPALTSAP